MKSKALVFRSLILAGMAGLAASAWAADPYIGYIYPAGAKQGSVVRVNIGGQRMAGPRGVFITGTGVQASVIEFRNANGPLNQRQQDELKMRLTELQTPAGRNRLANRANKNDKIKLDPMTPRIELPDLPELRNLESLTRAQLQKIRDKFLNTNKKTKPPIAETATVEIKINADAAPGDRELRLLTAGGLTNPIIFQVSQLAEVTEPDPDDIEPYVKSVERPSIVFNGRIMPGETDTYQLQLKQGQNFVFIAQARHLIPYLADAVPGWFQALLTLADPSGKDVASADHNAFDPDPVLNYTVPKDGIYTLKVRDTLFRGRKDFVYRVIAAESQSLPKILQPNVFSQRNESSVPACKEIEPNNNGQQSQSAKLPSLISGRIERAGDVDVYKITGRAGDEIVAEIYARRLGSSMDSLVRLISASGKVVALNDDCKDSAMGLLTHHADSCLTAKLPATGIYYVQVSEAQRHGGDAYNYELRISPKQPDFALRITPSSINIPGGSSVPVTVYAVRKDGWNGDIDVSLKNAPVGFTLSGARIPAGKDSVRMTLSAPSTTTRARQRFTAEPVALQIEGKATIGGKTTTQNAVPAQNMMQAFAYQHLVPSQQLLAMVLNARNTPKFTRAGTGALSIPAGGEAQVAFSINPMPSTPLQLVISEPPAGLTLGDIKTTPSGLTCEVKADAKQAGYSDNLILEVFSEIIRDGAKGAKKERVSLGVLPAIPIEVISTSTSKETKID